MLILGPLGFTTPWILGALVLLPVLWILLRAVPPAPLRQLFPGVILLRGIEDKESEADRTPWWLLLLRLLAIGAMVLGFSGPILHPVTDGNAAETRQPLLIFFDTSWASAPDWNARIKAAQSLLETAAAQGRLAALATSEDQSEPDFRLAADVVADLPGMKPVAWATDYAVALEWVGKLQGMATVWISDGLDWNGRKDVLQAFENAGSLRVIQPLAARLALRPVVNQDGILQIEALRSQGEIAQDLIVIAHGPGPGGEPRELARLGMNFPIGQTVSQAQLSVPPELRNRITHFTINGEFSAGAVTLADDSLRRRRIGLVGNTAGREGLELLSPLHYLRNALTPNAELVEGEIAELVRVGADVIVLADVPGLSVNDEKAVAEWVAKGGLLLRFAGPRLAAADTGRGVENLLLPVRLRAGGRVVGGAMSWGEARAIAPFPATSPFYGLTIPNEVKVSAQVLAEPGPDLAKRTIAALADGTPLVTQKTLGEGRVVLFHVTANAEWSGLPLSGLFIEMLERLAVSTKAARPDAATLAGTRWLAVEIMDGFGILSPSQIMASLPGEAMNDLARSQIPPGIYADDNRQIAINVTGPETELNAFDWPARIVPEWGEARPAKDLSGWLWLLALVALGIDIIAALFLSGRMPRRGGATLVAMLAFTLSITPFHGLRAQNGLSIEALISAASEVTLAYVITGDADVDRVSQAGLSGLSNQIFRRTSIEPANPLGINLETDELSVFPLIYWPVTLSQTVPSQDAYVRLRRYLDAGGMVLFDTRDAHVSGFTTAGTPLARRLRLLAEPLDVPPLEPVPQDHVLTRTFYLLEDFPGRHANGDLWVEAAPADAELAEGMPFRNLNDGVSPVMIGGNDWAAAWAVMPNGSPMFHIGQGRAGERQREMAYRFGINLVMHVLTGNYKSDQVHVPALLERLGQ